MLIKSYGLFWRASEIKAWRKQERKQGSECTFFRPLPGKVDSDPVSVSFLKTIYLNQKGMLMAVPSKGLAFALMLFAAGGAIASTEDAEGKGEREGWQYRQELVANGITPDRTACAIGMAAGDANNPQYTQDELDAYLTAFGNACVGRKVL